jgi:hypothetical protein
MAKRNSGGPRRSSPYRFRSAIAALSAATVVLSLFAAGCASPGEPTARKPSIPQAVSNVTASQLGNNVLLTFSVPKYSVGGAQLEHPPAVQIYRDFETAPTPGETHVAAPKRPTLLVTIPSELVARYTVNGTFRYDEQLQVSDFTDHPDSIVVFSVRTRASSKKPSSSSNLASLRIYPAPDPISELQGRVTPTAVVLTWAAPRRTPLGRVPPLAGYRIYRGEAQATPVASASSEAASPAAASSPSTSAPLPGIPASPPALRTPLVKIGESASLRFSDANAEYGRSYVYSVRSVLDYSGAMIESADSNFLTIVPSDTFPPAAPRGLIGIAVPASSGVSVHVDLSWAVSSEPDLAGYRLYRSEEAGVLGTPLGKELLLTPAFRDMNVVSGRRYYYAVTAMDRSGNESAPSIAVSVVVPAVTQPSHD